MLPLHYLRIVGGYMTFIPWPSPVLTLEPVSSCNVTIKLI